MSRVRSIVCVALLATASFAQLMPSKSSQEDLKKLKVSAPVNYDMLVKIPDGSAQDSISKKSKVKKPILRGRSEIEISREYARKRKETPSTVGSVLLETAKVVGKAAVFLTTGLLSDGEVSPQLVDGVLTASGMGISVLEDEKTDSSSNK